MAAGALQERQHLVGLSSFVGGDIGSCLEDEDGPEATVLVPNSMRDFFGGGGSGRRT